MPMNYASECDCGDYCEWCHPEMCEPFVTRCASCGLSANELYRDAANTIPDELNPICCEVAL